MFSSPQECTYGRAPNGTGPSYLRYHAEVFAGQEVSCWEKHQLELEIVRMTARAA